MVFDRYPEGGNERLLALAMADHARDDGTRIWPSVAELARKTLQSERTVQRQIANMVERGWLQVVRRASGRPGDTNEYRIDPAWIAGGEIGQTGVNLSPVSAPPAGPTPVDNVIHTGDKAGETGDKSGETGDTAMSPESSGTIRNHIPPLPPAHAGGGGQREPRGHGRAAVNRAPKRAPRAGYRWQRTFEGVCERGAQLGMPYSTAALGSAWTDDQLREYQRAYRKQVEALHADHARAEAAA